MAEERTFTVVIPEDVVTFYGNVQVPAGTYEAREFRDSTAAEGAIVIDDAPHYTGRNIGVVVPAYRWHFPGEEPRPIPEHDCFDHLATGVVAEDDTLYCGICQEAVL